MRRFFTDKKLTVGTEIVLDGEEAKHIMTVLRMKPGDELLLINGTGREMTARILNENKGEVRLEAISDAPCPSDLPFSSPNAFLKACFRVVFSSSSYAISTASNPEKSHSFKF